MTLVPAVAADDLAGASGECYSDGEYDEGGEAYIAVTEDGEVRHEGIVDEYNPTDPGVVQAASTFAQGQANVFLGEQDEACEAPEDDGEREGKDYVEVHAGPAQFCYDKEPHAETDPDAWACEPRPHGPPEE